MKKRNNKRSNPRIFQNYTNIIANSYSQACFKEARRLLGLYFQYLGNRPPSTDNFPSFFIRYRNLKPNSRARYYSYFSGFFNWYSGERLPFKVKTARIEPQLGVGGWAPMPRKLSVASMRMASAIIKVAMTITGASTLGRM